MKGSSVPKIVIYLEGGGSKEMRGQLRLAMRRFLRGAFAGSRASVRIEVCGPRSEAFKQFRAARSAGKAARFLLIDSEGPVDWDQDTAVRFLARQDKWDLGFAEDDRVHLMVQFMETWIVADPNALAGYFGRGFREKSLPSATDLESVSKSVVFRALAAATAQTGKANYRKGRDSAELIRRVDPVLARARCRGCERLFRALAAAA